ncbi:MAG: nucleotidyltransferase domain-containing protein [Candidatus Rokubacteria bacterium]|nr:nucleotidyltransferase domain-containing protein [Candidatus Rokubacteria bacterium]
MATPGLDEIARRHGVRLLLQFGSSVTGRVHARSDADLGVLLDRPGLTLEEHGALLSALQHQFPERPVDLAILNHADPLFLKQVTDDCRLLHGDSGLLQRLKIYAFKRYQDHRRYLELERRFVAKSLSDARG